MVAVNKKRISSELLHIALVITLLRGNDNRYYRHSPVISTNFFNDVSVSDDIMGPSWAYSRTSFHHLYDPPMHDIKTIQGQFGLDDSNSDSDLTEDDLDVDLNIINQLRLLTLSRFNSLPRLGKDQTTFQDITAYLLSESTSPSNAVSAPDNVVEYGSSAASPEQSEMEMSEQETLLMSPDVDSGHEETGDDADANSTTSETVKEFPLEVPNPVPRNSQRRESNGFHSDSEEEMANHETLPGINESIGLGAEVKIERENNEQTDDDDNLLDFDPSLSSLTFTQDEHIIEEDVKVKTEEELHDTDTQAEIKVTENQDDIWLNEAPEEISMQLSPLLVESELDQTTLELLQHVHENEIGGAAGIDHPSSSISELLGLEAHGPHDDLSELLLEAERSSLEFYKKFNDISENELHNAIAPQNLHDFDADAEEVRPSTSYSNDVGESSEKLRERDVVPSAGSSVEVSAQDTQDMLTAMLDDFLETDSGVFDFLDTSSERGDDDFSENSPLSITEGLIEDATVEAEESSFSAELEMIQTAPIHASARPTSHAAQPRGFQVHARMPGLLRSGSMEQRWQDLANLLSLQSSSHDPSAAGIHQPIPHHFPPHPYHHHHHHHTPTPLHHSMHPPHFGSAVPPATPYTTETARSVLLQNATLPPPELNATGPYGNVGMGASSNLGSAVASSMHLTNSSEPMIDPSSHYKMMDPSHDMLYYQNSTNEMANQTSGADGFNLSSILNDDELQLMDMAMSEGMYSMRMMDNGMPPSNLTTVGAVAGSIVQGPPNPPPPPPTVSHNGASSCTVLGATGGATGTSTEDRMEASSDSAVSSMGSERVPPMTDPPMSDNEWVDADSHPHGPHDLSPYSMDYSRGKLGGYDYYKDGSRVHGGPVAQKKHHMFGKRFQQEQSSHPYPLPSHLSYPPQHGSASQGSSIDLDKYNCAADFGRYNGQRALEPSMSNHTYALPPTHPDNPHLKVSKSQPQKEKPKMIKYFKSDEALTRDEKKARAMNIPITTDDIINLPMDEFNERLSKFDLSETQLSLIRDIRRRGKNKVAAQNCRKRKLDQILQLADEVQRIREKKQALMREQEGLLTRRTDLKERYSLLYRTVFQALRDSDGNPYSPYEFNLQHAADGSVVLLPRNVTQPSTSTSSNENGMSHSNNGRRDKSKDESKKE